MYLKDIHSFKGCFQRSNSTFSLPIWVEIISQNFQQTNSFWTVFTIQKSSPSHNWPEYSVLNEKKWTDTKSILESRLNHSTQEP